MLNIVIPMAGAGSRFQSAGYQKPKPLIQVFEKTMIELVIKNLTPNSPHQFIFICQKEHEKKYLISEILNKACKNPVIIEIDGITEGALCTVLKAEQWIHNNHPLMIANSDQYIDSNVNDYLEYFDNQDLDGLIMVMKAIDSKWSYVKTHNGLAVEVAEKKPISNDATVGIYNFKRGDEFVKAAHQMIALNQRVNNEFYVAPVYNILIENKKKIGIWSIGSDSGEGMHGLGTPDDLNRFLNHPKSKEWCK